MKISGEMSGLGIFFWEFGGGSSGQRERAHQSYHPPEVPGPQLSEKPHFYLFHKHSTKGLCIQQAMHAKTNTDVTGACDMVPVFMGASTTLRIEFTPAEKVSS